MALLTWYTLYIVLIFLPLACLPNWNIQGHNHVCSQQTRRGSFQPCCNDYFPKCETNQSNGQGFIALFQNQEIFYISCYLLLATFSTFALSMLQILHVHAWFLAKKSVNLDNDAMHFLHLVCSCLSCLAKVIKKWHLSNTTNSKVQSVSFFPSKIPNASFFLKHNETQGQ